MPTHRTYKVGTSLSPSVVFFKSSSDVLDRTYVCEDSYMAGASSEARYYVSILKCTRAVLVPSTRYLVCCFPTSDVRGRALLWVGGLGHFRSPSIDRMHIFHFFILHPSIRKGLWA